MEEAIIKKLFRNISVRLRNENNLSDILYAFCLTSDEFLHIFLEFFFSDYKRNEKVIEFTREFSSKGSRPDFYIKTDCKSYIIEIKLNDRNHHFTQYKEEFGEIRFGYIANYYLPKKNNVEVRNWTEFYNFIQQKIENNEIKENSLFEIFLIYLKNVCNVIKINKVDLSNIKSLANFSLLLDKVLSTLEGYETPIFDFKVSNIDFNRYGKYFSLTKIGDEYTIWPWIGLYFTTEKQCIYIEINKDWCEKEFINLRNKELTEGKYFIKPYEDDEYRISFAFEMKEEYFIEFNKLENVNEQENLIKNYLIEVLDYINK